MRTILVVEDEPQIAALVRDYLEHAGFAVLAASDGRGGLAVARTRRPDAIVLDLGLPGLDGLDVVRALRRDTEIPILMLTARGDEADRVRAGARGRRLRGLPFSPGSWSPRGRPPAGDRPAACRPPVVGELDIDGRHWSPPPGAGTADPTELSYWPFSRAGAACSRATGCSTPSAASAETYERDHGHVKTCAWWSRTRPRRSVMTVHGVAATPRRAGRSGCDERPPVSERR
jgi:CheY-like chemotaxis protein